MSTVIRRVVRVWIILFATTLFFTTVAIALTAVGTDSALTALLSILLSLSLSTVLIISDHNRANSLLKHDDLVASPVGSGRPRLIGRALLFLRGAPRLDLIIDVARLTAFAILIIGFFAHLIFDYPILHGNAANIAIVSCMAVALFTSLIYPLIKGESRWNMEYRYRKALSAHALNYVAKTLTANEASDVKEAVQMIERDALAAIKSYLEYSLLDWSGNNFNVNLLVVHPQEPSIMVCVARTGKGEVPTFYRTKDMRIASTALAKGQPIYIGDFRSSRGRPYKMVWHIPIASEEGSTRGLVAIDSLVSGHLDLLDNRESLLFNLLPYLALLRFSLALRNKNRIWHSIFWEKIMAGELPSAVQEYFVDRGFDAEALKVASVGNWKNEYAGLRLLTESLKPVSFARRLFAILFHNVEKNSQRLRA